MKADRIINYLRAGFSAFWLRTSEHDHVKSIIYRNILDFTRKDGGKYNLMDWSVTNQKADPTTPIQRLTDAEENTIMFIFNAHWHTDKMKVVQMIQDNIRIWSNQGKAIVCVSYANRIPPELEKDFILLDLALPDEKEINTIIQNVAPSETTIPETPKKQSRLLNSCRGLTRSELENVLALSIVETGGKGIDIPTINAHKAMTIQKTGFLDVLKGNVNFSNVIGYDNLKQFIIETIDNPKAKGIMTIGPPGCGKTQLMKAVVGETGKFGLSVNMGNLFSKYQGETDKNINTVIELITAIGDCVVLIDEFEKQFAGASGDGSLDSGVARRATGRWLEFLQDRPEGVYIVGTANSFNGIPGEYLRPGRWDTSPFFIDLPTTDVCKSILKYYCDKCDLTYKKRPSMTDYTGAEIEAMVHIADMRDISLIDASKCIIPQAKTMAESISKLREWAKDRTIPAETVIKSGKDSGGKVVKIKRRKLDA